jgi:hypothetical protein
MTINRSKLSKLTTTVPPRSGPVSGGLNIKYNTVKTVKTEKINGYRQKSTQRRTNNKIT